MGFLRGNLAGVTFTKWSKRIAPIMEQRGTGASCRGVLRGNEKEGLPSNHTALESKVNVTAAAATAQTKQDTMLTPHMGPTLVLKRARQECLPRTEKSQCEILKIAIDTYSILGNYTMVL